MTVSLRHLLGPLCVLSTLAVPTTPAAAETNINLLFGGKALDEADWSAFDAESQGSFGIMTTFGPSSWPVQIAIDSITSGKYEEGFRLHLPGDEEIRGRDLAQASGELDFGVRKIWKNDKIRPFVGGGFGLLWAKQERFVGSDRPGNSGLVAGDSDGTVGLWVDGGVFWRLGKHFNLGVEGRLSRGEVELAGRDVQIGGNHLGILLGWGWGAD